MVRFAFYRNSLSICVPNIDEVVDIDYGWTTTHGYYLQMGGFMLYEPETNTPIGVLSHEKFRDLLKRKKVRMPLISKDDIEDRSKSDGLSKAFVVIQTTWFIAQCIARKAKGLEITEFELVTASFAALNGVMYFLWWNKPLDVHSAVPVYLLPDSSNQEPMTPRFRQTHGSYSDRLEGHEYLCLIVLIMILQEYLKLTENLM